MAEVQEEKGFQERLIERLESEYSERREPTSVGKPAEQTDLDTETPELEAESEDEADGALSADETDEDESSDLDDEIPEEDDSEEVTDWEVRYKEVQAELSRATERKAEREAKVKKVAEEFTRGKFEFEDASTQARQAFEFILNSATAEANQARQINLAQVPPDQVAAAQNWMQQALAKEQQVKQGYSQFAEHIKAEQAKQTQREAVVARSILEDEIPDFDNAYPAILKHMVDLGMDQERAAQTIDVATIRAYYNSMKLNEAPNTVEVKKETKARAPKSRLSQSQPRGIDGKYKKVDEAYRNTTDKRQRAALWEERQKLKLTAEGKRR